MLLDGAQLLSYPLHVFERSPLISEVILVASDANKRLYQELVQRLGLKKVRGVVRGGSRRQDSVLNGLKAVAAQSQIALIHDGARPFVTLAMIQAGVEAAAQFGACAVGVPVKATTKECDEERFVSRTLRRDRLWEIQTPQVFQLPILREAYERASAMGLEATDDSSIVEAAGQSVKIIDGSYENIKITTPEDLLLAELILKKQKEGSDARRTRI